ncbi:MAG: hypothetical protein HXN24_07420 [Porphyromonas sp.]|jgi:hypothetical protein|nr:hypothetical protein [Porphyromonas sp.]
MAVTGIRKTSSYTFLALVAISVIVFALFLFGGSELDMKDNKVYAYTDVLIYWTYALGILSVVTVLFFVVKDFIAELAASPSAALKKIAGPIALIVLLLVTYAIGDTTPLKLNEEAQRFNAPFWLKFSDMWIYSVYVLLFLTIVAAIAGAVKSALNR